MSRSSYRGNYEPSEPELEEIEDCVAVANTDKAVLVRHEGSDYWIPFSMIDTESEVKVKGNTGTLIIPRWLAAEKGIV